MFGALSKLEMSLIAGAVIVAVFGGWLMLHDRKVVEKERIRVETTGARIDAKAQKKRAVAESNPDLGRWYRD